MFPHVPFLHKNNLSIPVIPQIFPNLFSYNFWFMIHLYSPRHLVHYYISSFLISIIDSKVCYLWYKCLDHFKCLFKLRGLRFLLCYTWESKHMRVCYISLSFSSLRSSPFGILIVAYDTYGSLQIIRGVCHYMLNVLYGLFPWFCFKALQLKAHSRFKIHDQVNQYSSAFKIPIQKMFKLNFGIGREKHTWSMHT